MRRPFATLRAELRPQSPLRAAITKAYRVPEPECVPPLVALARMPHDLAGRTHALAVDLAQRLRARSAAGGKEGLVQGLIQEFALSSQEGVALMCLAEALLRIPDNATRDALIRDKIGDADWQAHLGRSPSVFVNAATWGLLLTGKLVATHTEGGLASALSRVVARGGEPIVRRGVDMAMRVMGEQFVTGETIGEALSNARRRESEGFRHSYDMLGEAALTEDDAQRYLAAYREAIHAIGAAAQGRGIQQGPGISIKLSALHPRYSRAQYERVMQELYPRLRELAALAMRYDIGLNIDAEEADRLEISLDLLQRLCAEPALAGWNGIGFVIQAYQKRCLHVIDELVDCAQRTHRRIMVRLVKGAYWDSEIKRAQVDGLAGYPVFTRKAYTDVSYLACAHKLLAQPAAIYPQFATHNAHTLAAVYQMAGPDFRPGQYEFQCLHGMGEPLYEHVVAPVAAGGLGRPCRIYAPVGSHETLLAYLVRRLLENGANTSFVNRVADAALPIAALVADPVATADAIAVAEGMLGAPHPAIALPGALFGDARVNSAGIDLTDESRLALLAENLERSPPRARAAPRIGGVERTTAPAIALRNPADRRVIVGDVHETSAADIDEALARAASAVRDWSAMPPALRAQALLRAADAMQAAIDELVGLMIGEAGKTYANAAGEVREAVDFLRYYAIEARDGLVAGRDVPLGVVVAISPWNFPLSIFTGQVAAALAAGNVVIAKPAEQTPLVAARAVALLIESGVHADALQLLPGRGETVGAALVADVRVRGVVFTGSNAVAALLQRALAGRLDAAGRLPTLIAETGGQNAMIVDSSALTEQVVNDVVASAFDSAGQRCSALRVLCVQEDVAEPVLAMLRGAMGELALGDPGALATDIGPVIDAEALAAIVRHIAAMRDAGHRVFQPPGRGGAAVLSHGTFVPPTLIELDHIAELRCEVFGPVLHVVRFRREALGALLADISATGYGLTLGLHTRIDETIDYVIGRARAGNLYVNRNMIGAVVGVQPFGGEGLSGTGPKAGGPLYLRRLLASGTEWGDDRAAPPSTAARGTTAAGHADPAFATLRAWIGAQPDGPAWAAAMGTLATVDARHASRSLGGPTGERNTYSWVARRSVLCIARERGDLLLQVATVLACGSAAVLADNLQARALHAELPAALHERVTVDDALNPDVEFALVAATRAELVEWSVRLAARDGAILGIATLAPGTRVPAYPIERLRVERSLSINSAAAGGNASLMTIG